jgi:hypothetical protein
LAPVPEESSFLQHRHRIPCAAGPASGCPVVTCGSAFFNIRSIQERIGIDTLHTRVNVIYEWLCNKLLDRKRLMFDAP